MFWLVTIFSRNWVMAKKRIRPNRRITHSKRRGSRTNLPIGRVLWGLTILVLLVLAGAVVAHFLVPRPVQRTVKIASAPPPAVKKVPSTAGKTKPQPDGAAKAATSRPVSTPTAPKPAQRTPTLAAVKPMVPEKPTYEIFSPKVESGIERPQMELPPKMVHTPMVAIIVDDLGYDRVAAERLLAIDAPLTFSVLPFSPFSKPIMAAIRAKGREILLHLPMEPEEFPTVKPGPGALLSAMTPDQLIDQLNRNIDQIPGLKGVNNHMGSRVSTSSEQMRQIFSVLKKRGLFYIDSRTTPDSVARLSANLLELPFAERDIFIDHYDNPAFIQSQLGKLIQHARKHGYAIGIGHPHANTVAALARFIPQLNGKVQVVSVSKIVQTVMLAKAEKKKAAQAAKF